MGRARRLSSRSSIATRRPAARSPSSSNGPMPPLRSIRRSGVSSLLLSLLAARRRVRPEVRLRGWRPAVAHPDHGRYSRSTTRRRRRSSSGSCWTPCGGSSRPGSASGMPPRRDRTPSYVGSSGPTTPTCRWRIAPNPAQAVTARRRLRITLDVQIVDLTTNKTIWEKKGLQCGRGVRRAGRGRRSSRGAQTNRE